MTTDEIFQMATNGGATKVPDSKSAANNKRSSQNVPSFAIVNSERNGKRFSISGSIVKYLGLVAISPEQNESKDQHVAQSNSLQDDKEEKPRSEYLLYLTALPQVETILLTKKDHYPGNSKQVLHEDWRKGKKTGRLMCYNGPLVEQLTSDFCLDYIGEYLKETCSSKTFEAKLTNDGDTKVAIVKIPREYKKLMAPQPEQAPSLPDASTDDDIGEDLEVINPLDDQTGATPKQEKEL